MSHWLWSDKNLISPIVDAIMCHVTRKQASFLAEISMEHVLQGNIREGTHKTNMAQQAAFLPVKRITRKGNWEFQYF